MANAADFRIAITAIDQATLTIMGIKEKFSQTVDHMKRDTQSITAPVAAVGNSLKNLADESGLTTVARHAKGAFFAVGHLLGSVVRLGGTLAGLAGIGSVGGILDIAKEGAEYYEKLGLAAAKTGTTMEHLARLRYSAQLRGVDNEAVDKALTYLNRSIRPGSARREQARTRSFSSLSPQHSS